jgi:hypothetical protein
MTGINGLRLVRGVVSPDNRRDYINLAPKGLDWRILSVGKPSTTDDGDKRIKTCQGRCPSLQLEGSYYTEHRHKLSFFYFDLRRNIIRWAKDLSLR